MARARRLRLAHPPHRAAPQPGKQIAAHLLGRERPRGHGHVRRLQQLHLCKHLPILRARSAPRKTTPYPNPTPALHLPAPAASRRLHALTD